MPIMGGGGPPTCCVEGPCPYFGCMALTSSIESCSLSQTTSPAAAACCPDGAEVPATPSPDLDSAPAMGNRGPPGGAPPPGPGGGPLGIMRPGGGIPDNDQKG